MKTYNEFINKKVISINENVNTDDLSNLNQEELNSKLEDYLKENDVDNIISVLNHGAHLKINVLDLNNVMDQTHNNLYEQGIEENDENYDNIFNESYELSIKSLIMNYFLFKKEQPDNHHDIFESMEVKKVGQKDNFFLYQVKINEKPIFY